MEKPEVINLTTKPMAIFSFLIIFPSIALAQTTVNAYGECRDFDVVITTDLAGCYDVKLDVAGTILNEDEWKSTFFYVSDALCNNTAGLKLHLDTDDNVTGVAKLRQNDTIIAEEPFMINQNCPDIKLQFFATVIAIIIILSVLIVWYRKK